MDEKGMEERIETLRLRNEQADQEVSLAQKKALIREAKEKYGKGWKKALGIVKSIRVDKEALHSLHSLGIGGDNRLRDLNDPTRYRGLRD